MFRYVVCKEQEEVNGGSLGADDKLIFKIRLHPGSEPHYKATVEQVEIKPIHGKAKAEPGCNRVRVYKFSISQRSGGYRVS